MAAADLDALLARAASASPLDRMELRDPIAAHGEPAMDAMKDWLADPRQAAFAVRVLERIGREPACRSAAVATLAAVDAEQLRPGVTGDIETALVNLGALRRAGARPTRPATLAERITGLVGVEGRGYWVMRASPGERPFIWAEATAGSLRQGWGCDATQDLDAIAEVVRLGTPLRACSRLLRSPREARVTYERDTAGSR